MSFLLLQNIKYIIQKKCSVLEYIFNVKNYAKIWQKKNLSILGYVLCFHVYYLMKNTKLFLSYMLYISLFVIIFLCAKTFAYQANHDSFLNIPSHAWFDDAVYITTLQDDRKIFVWGEFTTYDWSTANRIIRLFSDGRRDTSFNIWSWFNDAVRAIVIQNDGKIIVWWHFTDYNWVTANRIIRLNPDGSVDNSFVTWSGFNAQVRTIALQEDGKMIVWWAIVNYSWTTIYRIVRLNSNGSIDTSFNVWLGFNNNVRSIAFQEDGKIILGGWFLIYSWTTTNRIIRLNPDGSRDNSFIIWTGFNDQINMVVMQSDGKFLVWWLFTGYNWTSVNRIARLNNDGSIDTSFAIWSWFDTQVVSLITYNDKIIVGWGFASYNWTPINRIVRLNDDGSIDTSFDIWIWYNNVVRSLSVQSDGKILVGWDFTGYQSTSFGRLMRLHGESNISLLDTDNEDVIRAEFLSKWYTLSQSVLSWSAPMVFIDTEWRVPVQLKLKNEKILLTLPQGVEIKDSSTMSNYTWVFTPPTFIANSKSETITTIQAWSSTTWLSLVNWLATLSIPVDDAEAWDLVEIFYSEDNGETWSTQTKTFVDDIDGQAYVSFTTDHFTDFAISTPLAMTGSFTINDDDVSTPSQNVTLNISTTPAADQMRFSNDGISWSTREAYATSKAWTLSAGTWTKTVYVQFDTNGDDISDIEVSDEIEYIDAIPTCPPWSYCGDVTLRIDPLTAQCVYGTSVHLGITGFSYSAQSLSTWFLNTFGEAAWYCQDTEWDADRALSIQMLTDLINQTNTSYSIPRANVLISNYQAIESNGDCTPDLIAQTNSPIDIVKQLFGKDSALTEICTITTTGVNIGIDIPAAQNIWVYSGTIQISYDGTLGNSEMD